MSRRLLPAVLGFGVCTLVALLFFHAMPEGQSWAQPPSTTDQKLDEILKKLTQIDQRVAALEKKAGLDRRLAIPAAPPTATIAEENLRSRRATALPALTLP